MRDKILALIFVVLGFAMLNFRCNDDLLHNAVTDFNSIRVDLEAFAHKHSNCPCVNQQIVGLASIDQFKPLGRSDTDLKQLLGNPLVRELEDDPDVDEIWSHYKYRLVLWMKNHRCIAAYPYTSVFH